ncbi:hypothetical protein [Gemmata sp.]|uniref:hypothetical protein n=1 Tax=Gemmata sp. TaxID=1914242 RepID=UPI003F712302
MTSTAHCLRCDRAFAFDTDAVRFAASFYNGSDGRPAACANYLPECPGCRGVATVPYTRPLRVPPAAQ